MESTIKPMDSAKKRNSFVNVFRMSKNTPGFVSAGNIN
jgi:hypothetical protein